MINKPNFQIRVDGSFGNKEGCNYGCCYTCKYSVSGENWMACSEACFRKHYGSCLNCDHRPDYMLRKEEAFYEFN